MLSMHLSLMQKNIGLGSGKPITPATYKYGKVELENHKGEVYEIQNIITKFEITESIFSNTLMCKVNIKDTNNLIEDFPIMGQEKLRFNFEKPGVFFKKKVQLEFSITEYPGFGKGVEKYMQAFSLTGISNHAYNSPFKKISRAVEGTTSEIIESIMLGDLKMFIINIMMQENLTTRHIPMMILIRENFEYLRYHQT